MKKFSLIALLMFATLISWSQDHTKEFEIELPENKVSQSHYNVIEFIDSREDTTDFGKVQTGALNRQARVVPKVRIPERLSQLLSGMIDSSAKDGVVLFQLRKLKFAELTGAWSEKGFCYLFATLYAKKDGQYYKLQSLDTLIVVKAADVTKKIFKTTGDVVRKFLALGVTRDIPAQPRPYSYSDVVAIDSVEKRGIPIYNTTVFNDGIYKNYISFFNNTPDEKDCRIKLTKKKTISAIYLNTSGQELKLKPKQDVYALVYEGKPYAATSYGYYPLVLSEDNFYFIGKEKVSPQSTDVMVASMMFGMLGSALASIPYGEMFEFRLNHQNGIAVSIRKIPVPDDF